MSPPGSGIFSFNKTAEFLLPKPEILKSSEWSFIVDGRLTSPNHVESNETLLKIDFLKSSGSPGNGKTLTLTKSGISFWQGPGETLAFPQDTIMEANFKLTLWFKYHNENDHELKVTWSQGVKVSGMDGNHRVDLEGVTHLRLDSTFLDLNYATTLAKGN